MTQKKLFLGRLVAVVLALAVGGLCRGARADDSQNIRLVVPTIDFPGTGVVGTRPFGINDLGNLSIEVFFSDGSEKVATRIRGHYSALSQPANTNLIASVNGINNFNVAAGFYLDSTVNAYRGFILKNGAYTVFDVTTPGATFTALYGINDFGDVSGLYGSVTPGPHSQAFRKLGNNEADLNVNASVGSAATGINDLRQTVGFFSQSDPFLAETTCGCHGVIWDRNGGSTTFDTPGAVSTRPLGINIAGWVAGRFFDIGGVMHAFAYNQRSAKFLIYDYPNAIQTTFNGINDLGYLAGRYSDKSGTAHGFIARIVGEDHD
jgi:hypothetical protein